MSLSDAALFRRAITSDSLAAAILAALDSHGVPTSPAFLDAWMREDGRRMDGRWTDLSEEPIAGLLERLSSQRIDEPESVVRAAAESLGSRMEWHPDVLPTLDSLRESGYRIAAVLDSSMPLGPSWEERIAPWIDVVVSPRETGRAPPHPDVFRELTGRVAALPKQVLHVGEGLVADVFGGKNAGVRTALLERVPRRPQDPRSLEWLRRVHGLAPEAVIPDLRVKTLEEVPVVLDQFG